MPYSNDYNQIEAGLVNYLGAALSALPSQMEARAKAHYLIASLMREITKLAQREDAGYDLYIYKPVFRSMIYVLTSETERMKEDLPYTKEIIESYDQLIALLEPFTKDSDSTKQP